LSNSVWIRNNILICTLRYTLHIANTNATSETVFTRKRLVYLAYRSHMERVSLRSFKRSIKREELRKFLQDSRYSEILSDTEEVLKEY